MRSEPVLGERQPLFKAELPAREFPVSSQLRATTYCHTVTYLLVTYNVLVCKENVKAQIKDCAVYVTLRIICSTARLRF